MITVMYFVKKSLKQSHLSRNTRFRNPPKQTVFEFKKFGNWLSFPKKVGSTEKLKTGIKSEQNNFGTLFCAKFIRDIGGML